jgi:hypothetical protein
MNAKPATVEKMRLWVIQYSKRKGAGDDHEEDINNGASGLETSLVHQLPYGVGKQHRPRAWMVP